jgi:hypothetical protein
MMLGYYCSVTYGWEMASVQNNNMIKILICVSYHSQWTISVVYKIRVSYIYIYKLHKGKIIFWHMYIMYVKLNLSCLKKPDKMSKLQLYIIWMFYIYEQLYCYLSSNTYIPLTILFTNTQCKECTQYIRIIFTSFDEFNN